ncbi:MAG: hypothetical protein COC22_03720 [Flavobacteriaceae bacterium]|nr:MAG: hypothetical protein COC22_03720 [Flavobacteriaceae bacterium]
MKRIKDLALIFLVFLVSNLYSQTTYKSSLTTEYKLEGEIIEKQRTITISDTKITISNFIGGTMPLNLKVNEIKEVEDDWFGLMKWYYCTEIHEKHTEFIIIMKKSYPTDMEVCQKVNEVTFIKNTISIK